MQEITNVLKRATEKSGDTIGKTMNMLVEGCIEDHISKATNKPENKM